MVYHSNYNARRIVLLAFLLMSLVGSILGQTGRIPMMDSSMDSGLGGSSSIEGNVIVSGQRLDRRIRVRLVTMTSGDRTSMTDEYGKFSFRGLTNGDYTIVIDGEKEFEPFSQRVNVLVLRGSPAQNYPISIRLIPKKGETEPKAEVVNAELANVPPKAVEFYNAALELSKQRDHKGAIEQLQAAIKEYSDFVLGYNEIGYQYMRLNDYEKAETAFQSALKIKPDAKLPLTNHGIVLICLKKFADAEKDLKKAIKLDESLPVAHYWLAYSIANQARSDGQNRFDEAEKEFLLAVKLGGAEMKEAHRYLAIIYGSKGDKKRQIAELETYLLLAPTATDADQLRKLTAQLKGEKN